MSSKKLTPWFKGCIKPVRNGVYQREYGAGPCSDIRFSYWDGVRWRWPSSNAQAASNGWRNKPPSAINELPWRGLAGEPNGATA